jgi:hypothetical protein
MLPEDIISHLEQSERRFRLAMVVLTGFAQDLVSPVPRSGSGRRRKSKARMQRANALRWVRQSRFPSIHPSLHYPLTFITCHAFIEDYAEKMPALHGAEMPAPTLEELRHKLLTDPQAFLAASDEAILRRSKRRMRDKARRDRVSHLKGAA